MSSEVSLAFNKAQHSTISEQDMEIIRSLEWLVFDTETYGDAVTAANLYLRYYLGEQARRMHTCSKSKTNSTLLFHTGDNNLTASRAILSSLPNGLIEKTSSQDSSHHLENQVLEFKLHMVLINALSGLEKAEREWQLNGVSQNRFL